MQALHATFICAKHFFFLPAKEQYFFIFLKRHKNISKRQLKNYISRLYLEENLIQKRT